MDQPDRILVVAETEKGQCTPLTFELLKAGGELAREKEGGLCACVLGHEVNGLAKEIAWYASRVYVIDDPLLSSPQPDLLAHFLHSVCLSLEPLSVIMGHTYENLEAAPKLSWALDAELITDCIRVERDRATNNLLCTKPVYGGNAQAVFELETTPHLALLRPKAYGPADKAPSQGEIVSLDCKMHISLALTEFRARVPGETINLDQAEVIVSAGRGVRNLEGIEKLKNLIEVLEKHFDRVELGASRPLIDEGLLPRSRQIGQTGERVSPQLYFAVGISGAIQHQSGIFGSKKIVAINKDRNAPIFGVADYGVAGSFEEVLPAFIRELAE